MPSARDIAASALGDRGGNVSAHLDRLLGQSQLSGADFAFARELALGAVRRKATLQAVLRAHLARPDQPLPAGLTNILHVALYKLLFLDRVPGFAAVNEAVKQASAGRFRSQAGMVNGILRSVLRGLSGVTVGKPPLSPEIVPVGAGAYRAFDRDIFPDPAGDAAAYIAAAYSLPIDLARRWTVRHGLEGAVELAAHADSRAPFILRVNRLKGDVDAARAALAVDGVQAVVHANGQSLVLAEHANIVELKAFHEGLIQPQDATATAVGLAAGVAPGMRVLDFCAAPGTKTTHLAELMDNRGSIVALDVSDDKLARIGDNCRRMGVSIVTTMQAPEVTRLSPESFDVVLADVPCSNTGVLARRAEARWQFDQKRLAAVVKDQRFLAAAAAMFVKRGGRMIYSTCSVEPEENEQLAAGLIRVNPRLKLVRQRLTLPAGADAPEQWHDGGYYAILSR